MKKLPHPFMRLLKATWHHLDSVILIVLAFIFAIGGLMGMAKDILNPIIVGMLGIIAISQLRSRSQISEVAATWHRARTELFSTGFPSEYKEAQSTVSHSYFYTGGTMLRTMTAMREHIPRILQNSGSVRILLPDPTNEHLLRMIAATHPDKTPVDIKADIENSLRIASQLRLRANKGTLDIRIIQFVPSLGINAMDLELPKKSIMVQMYEFDAPGNERAPIFLLTANDQTWFSHFEAQIERLWLEGGVYEAESIGD